MTRCSMSPGVAVREVAIFAADVPDRKTLIDGLRPGVAYHVLSPDGDGIAEIAACLAGYRDIEALHIVSHGSPGQIHLCGQGVDASTLESRRREIEALSSRFSDDASVYLYGCEVASGACGQSFVERLETLIGTPVSASAFRVGSERAGGTWAIFQDGPRRFAFDRSDIAEYEFALALISSPVTVDFEAETASDGGIDSGSMSFTSGDFVFTYSAQNIEFDSDDGESGSIGMRLSGNSGSSETLKIKTTSGDEFTFGSFFFTASSSGISSVEGFEDGSTTGTQTTGLPSSGDGAATVTLNGDMSDVDRVVITSDAGGWSDVFDNFEFAPPDITVDRTTGAGFDTTMVDDSNREEGSFAFDGDDETLAVKNVNHIDSASVVDGAGGTDTLLLNFPLSSDLSQLKTLANFEVLQRGGSSFTTTLASADVADFKTFDLDGGKLALSGTTAVDFTGTSFIDVSAVLGDDGGGDDITGSAGGDTIEGRGGTDTLAGGDGGDVLDGGAGGDLLVGGAGADNLTGGSGTDTFVGSAAELDGDTIQDLAVGETLRLTGITGLTGDNLRITPSDTLEIDTDATDFATPEVTIDLAASLSADFTVADNGGDTDIALTTATAPTLDSFSRQSPTDATTNADTLVFRATFSEAVQGVDTADFAVNGTTTATVTDVGRVDTSTYDVTISGGDLAGFNGSVGLDLASGQDIADHGNNALPAGEPGTDEVFTLDNTPPTFGAVSTQSFDEGASGAVFDADADDGGGADAGITYTLTGADADDFSIDTNGVLTFDSVPDFENPADDDADNTYVVDINAADAIGSTTTRTVTVDVNDLAPTQPGDTDGTADSVTEDAGNGTGVGVSADATDPGGGTVTYALTDNAGGRFGIDANTGAITVADASLIDFESAESHTVTVRAEDPDGTMSATKDFAIGVTDIDDNAVTLSAFNKSGQKGVGLNDTLTLTFDQAIEIGTGNITLAAQTAGASDIVVDVASGEVTPNGTDAIDVQPSGGLEAGVEYAVQFDAGVVGATGSDPDTVAALTGMGQTFITLPLARLSATDGTLAEDGSSETLTVSLVDANGDSVNAPSGGVDVTLSTAGTATGGGTDFSLGATTVTIADGTSSKTVDLTSVADSVLEGDETVSAEISSVTGGREDGTQAVDIDITDDETLEIADASGAEASGTLSFTVAVKDENGNIGSAATNTTFDMDTVDGTAGGGSDFAAVTGGSGQIDAGAGTTTVDVTLTDDAVLEADETFDVNLSNPSVGSFADATGQGTIVNDDAATVTIADISPGEESGTAALTLTLDSAVQGGFDVDVSTASGTATAGSDFTAVTNQTLAFAGTAGEIQSVDVTLLGDGMPEGDETFDVSMSNLTNAPGAVDIADTATVTIVDDDIPILQSLEPITNDPTNAGTVEFLATFSNAVDDESDVDATDFAIAASGTVSADPTVTVDDNSDTDKATFRVTVTGVSGDGSLGVDFDDDDSVTVGSVPIGGAGAGNGDLTGTTRDVDNTAPAVGVDSLTTNDTTPALTGTVDDVAASIQVQVDGQTGTAVNNGDGTWTLADDTLTTLAEGTFEVAVTATDAVGNAGGDATSSELKVDITTPSVLSFTRDTPSSQATNADALVFVATFDEGVRNVDAGDFTVTGTTATATGVNQVDAATYEVTVSGGDLAGLDGAAGLDMAGSPSVQDLAGNALSAATPGTDETFALDNTAPVDPVVTAPVSAQTVDANTLAITGTAVADSLVKVYRDSNDNGAVDAGETVVQSQQLTGGNTAFSIDASLDQGTVNDFVVTATDAAGNESGAVEVASIIDTNPSPPPPPPPADDDDDDLFEGDDQSDVDNDVDTGLDPTDDFEDETVDGAPATRGATTDRDTGEDVEVIAVNPVGDGERQDVDDTTEDVDVQVNDDVRASVSDNTGVIIAARNTGGRDNIATVVERGTDPDDPEARRDVDDFLNEALGAEGGDGAGEPRPLIELTPVRGADDADGQTRRLNVNVGDGSQDGGDGETGGGTGSGGGTRPVVVVDLRNFDGSGDNVDVGVNGAANIVVRGGGTFRGTEELARGGAPDVDNVVGDASDQVLFFGPGDDTIRGGGGDDEVSSAGGDDRLIGGSGDDVLIGGAGDDTLVSGVGDSAVGGLDGDTLELTGLSGSLTLVDPTVHDRIQLTDVSLDDGRLRVDTVQRDGEETALLRLDLDGDGQFQGGGDAAITLSRLARAEVTASDDGQGGTFIGFEGTDLQLGNLSVADQLSALYVAFLDRAPDPEGLRFWVEEYNAGVAAGLSSAAVFDDISEAIRLDDEAMAQFPVLNPDNGTVGREEVEAFVASVYDSLFNRAPEAAGLDFWADDIAARLETGINMGDLVVDIVAGALDGVSADADGDGTAETIYDASTIRNKVETGQQFAARLGDSDAAFGSDVTLADARGALDGVAGGYATFTDALDRVDTLIAGLTDDGLV